MRQLPRRRFSARGARSRGIVCGPTRARRDNPGTLSSNSNVYASPPYDRRSSTAADGAASGGYLPALFWACGGDDRLRRARGRGSARRPDRCPRHLAPNSACRRSAQGHSGPLTSSSALAAFSNSRILRPIVTLSVVHRSPPLKFPSSEMASRTCSRTRRTSMQALRVRSVSATRKTIAELLYPACRSASISLRFGSPVAREYKKCNVFWTER